MFTEKEKAQYAEYVKREEARLIEWAEEADKESEAYEARLAERGGI